MKKIKPVQEVNTMNASFNSRLQKPVKAEVNQKDKYTLYFFASIILSVSPSFVEGPLLPWLTSTYTADAFARS
ncbi:hypothetical protein RIR_jg8790.t1 [Rhizophagus irregularis DAOM 181602=DAOM 197198]|uniref:Uncharacterized protein n=1 Tax=Rhizophagus irregularis (strain DAOM 181602 / DAOM 197198 / MUCL 43194) TaxID=747089 RepID=U9SI73_RHIID|nr:hypothetical protein RIR_jg8790.t1 [Rhizophagus irregularis DAOM 181602=DAOM 197198]